MPNRYKIQAANLLVQEGYEITATPDNISHEVSLSKSGVCVDLHWHLMRPGRIPIDMTDYLLSNREPFADGIWGLNNSASLLVMLVHPAFTKHVFSPNSILIHLVDIHRLLEQNPSDWNAVAETLAGARLKTAAWSSLYMLHLLSGLDKYEALAKQIEPSVMKRKYLQYWIDHGLIDRYFNKPLILRTFFSLALQDTVMDMLGAVRSFATAKKTAAEQVREFQRLAQ